MKLLIILIASLCLVGTTNAGTTPGLAYTYYEGTWNYLPNFNLLTAVKKGTTSNINLGVASRSLSFGIVWQGYITISVPGDYSFETISDDGSQLFIDNSSAPLVNNDSMHSARSVYNTMHLNAGAHAIKIAYFQNNGGQTMDVYWSSNTGIARQKLPDNVLTSETASAQDLRGVHNYYFSRLSGDDTRTSLQAQDPATPWKTLNKLNSFMPSLEPGDAVLFKRGETFNGPITISKSGTAALPIICSAYGTGTKPVINGLTTVTAWTSMGGNIYEAALSGGGRVNMVTINGVVKAMGRYPNSSYYTIDSYTEIVENPAYTYQGTFTAAQIPASSINWKGAEAVIRKNDFTLDRCLITAHTGNTVSYNSPSRFAPAAGYGYFIQNSPQTLDQHGEWYYNPSTKKLRIYSTVDPSTLVVKAGTTNTLVSIDNKTGVTFDNIGFEGSDTSAFRITAGSSYINIQNCAFNFSGTDVLRSEQSNHITFANNTTNNTNSYAIIMYSGSDITVKNNSIKNTGMLAGMGLPNQQGYGGIFIQGGNTLIEGNVVDSVGSAGIAFNGGNNNTVRNNYVNYFCSIVGDGGGIYTNGNDGFTGKRIISNIVSNGIGIYQGTTSTTPKAANGIYIDEGGSNVEILNNTVFNCVSNGMYIHQSHELVINGNTLYNNSGSQLAMVDDQTEANRIRNLVINNNILFSKKVSQVVMYSGGVTNDLNQYGSFDSNYYARPYDQGGIISTQYKIAGGEVNSRFDLEGWKIKFPGRDGHSSPGSSLTRFGASNMGANIISNGTFNNNVNGLYPDANTTITLDAKLDGYAAKFTAKSPSISDIGALINLGSTIAGKSYRIRFSLLGSTNTQNLIAYVRRFNDPDYSIVSESKYFALRTSRTECEFVYNATVNEPDVKLTIIASGLLLPFWIDNVEVNAFDATANNIDDSIRFEYNNTNSVKSFPLNGAYTDTKNNKYLNTVNLAPYTSIILIRSQSQTVNQSASALATATVQNESSIKFLAARNDSTVSSSAKLVIYPNPVVAVLKTSYLAAKTGDIKLSVYDVNGIMVQSVNDVKHQVLFESAVNVGRLKAGLYFIELKFNDGTHITRSFIKK